MSESGICIVWGDGPVSSSRILEGDPTRRAAVVALAYGWTDYRPQAWAVEVKGTSEEIDSEVRNESSVEGWVPLVERPESYPWGKVLYPEGWEVKEVSASCPSDDHFSHPYCSPGWEEDVEDAGGLILEDAVLDSWSGWIALVAWPPML